MNILFNSRFISDASSYSDSSNHGFIPAKQIFHSIFSFPLIDLMATVLENISVEFTKLTEIASVLLRIAVGKRKNCFRIVCFVDYANRTGR